MRWIVIAQGIYYVVTGLWPWVSMRSFERVSGPKADPFLMQTVGALAIAVGVVLLFGALQRRVPARAAALAIVAAMAFVMVDILFVADGTVRATYLAEGALELAFLMSASFYRRAPNEPLFGGENRR